MNLTSTTDSAEARYQAVKAQLKAGDIGGARTTLASALLVWPHEPRLHWQMALIHRRDGHVAAAIENLVSALALDESTITYWEDLWTCLGIAPPPANNARFLDVISKALQRDGMDHTRAEVEAQLQVTTKLYGLEQAGFSATAWALQRHGESAHDDALRALLLTHLEYGATTRNDLETYLTRIRRDLLETLQSEEPDAVAPNVLELAAAMAIHCGTNEYVFSETTAETAAVEILQRRIQAALTAGGELEPITVVLLAAYRPLINEPDSSKILLRLPRQNSRRLARLLTLHIHDRIAENALKDTIPRLTAVADHTSQDVKAQYEENPYPRWHYLPVALPAQNQITAPRAQILVAGCGTGRHPLIIAAVSPDADVWAVDLSLSSLAYAKRKAAAYGASNIKFFQADILELGALTQRFDAISCEGVLHHLREPAAGLAVLHELLTAEGTLRMSVYVTSSRSPIKAGIALREHLGLDATPRGIRKFREAVYALPPRARAAALVQFRDFFFASECRDLVFHVQEHQYTLPELAALVSSAGFKVQKLSVPTGTLAHFRSRFPTADPYTDLAAWAEVENEQPGLFGPMYKVSLVKAGGAA